MQRHADFYAAVLERHHVLHVVSASQIRVAVAPDLENQLDLRQWKPSEALRWILREHDDLTGAFRGKRVDDLLGLRGGVLRERWEEVVEHCDVVVADGQFARTIGVVAWRQGIVLGWR